VFRRLVLGAAALIALLAVPSFASAVAPDPNPWLTNRFLNIAHQGGEDEAPSSTLFAFKSAVASRGADMLELDVNLSSDGELMVIHDDTWTRTSCTAALCPGPTSATEPQREASEVDNMTAAELQALDAGYWFRPNSYSHDYSLADSAYPYRGIRTGDVPPPPGYAPRDFRIPTLEEVLDAFPTTPINVEIKMVKTTTGVDQIGCVPSPTTYCDDVPASIPVAEAVADVLTEPDYAWRDDIIVASFSDVLVSTFHSLAPDVALAPGLLGVAGYYGSGTPPVPDVAAFQVPPAFPPFTGIPEAILNHGAHADGYAVHVWPNSSEPESEASYRRLIALGIDGYMASEPGRLHAVLCADEVPRPNGSDRCPNPPAEPPAEPAQTKRCKKGQKLKKGKCVKKKGKKAKKKRR
jgi:glycerophosphoryl diester phosphodiesterase